jgi:hypothetical protein
VSDEHSGLSHDLPEYVPNVLPERPPREETVKVALGDDYYKGAYFRTVDGDLDYEVPKSQLERWEDAEAAYEAMQDEIERVMREQADRVRALYRERHKDKPRTVPPALEEAYGAAIMRQLNQQLLLPRSEGT